jgi:hypothetical protein
MAAEDTLVTPFESWGEGLLHLADALDSVDRTEILVARLDATAQTTKITPNDICALALLTGSSARFDSSAFLKIEPDPRAVAAAQILNKDGAFNRHLEEIADYHERMRNLRERAVELAFPENDPRRLLKDTIFASAAVELYDIAQRMEDADPFARFSNRLSLWFRSPTAQVAGSGRCEPPAGPGLLSRPPVPAARKLISSLLGSERLARPLNHMRMFLAPDELRPFVENWPSVASALLMRARHEAMAAPLDHSLQSTWREPTELPNVSLPQLNENETPSSLCEIHLRSGALYLGLIGTVLTLGTPLDVTLQELRWRCLCPQIQRLKLH